MSWPNARENPGPPAPGRYCLAVCYCGDCDHYVPLPTVTRRTAQTIRHPLQDAAWWDQQRREDLRR